MTQDKIIKAVVDHVKSQIGVDLIIDDYFSGVRECKGEKYFNIELGDPFFISEDVEKLSRISGDDRIIESVQPNGNKRLAIFFNKNLMEL